jgi:DNA invertase Pin-like site-specific DNA recombinase
VRGCAGIFIEKISTWKAASERPGLTAALDYLRPGDTLVVSNLDRPGQLLPGQAVKCPFR